jgi:hypothetical protein
MASRQAQNYVRGLMYAGDGSISTFIDPQTQLRMMAEYDQKYDPEIQALGAVQHSLMTEFNSIMSAEKVRQGLALDAQLNQNQVLKAVNDAAGNITQSQREMLSHDWDKFHKARVEADALKTQLANATAELTTIKSDVAALKAAKVVTK